MHYVYFLELSNKDIYVGFSNNLKKRISMHQAGKIKSTKAFMPAILISYIAINAESKARELKIYFKSCSGKAIPKRDFYKITSRFRLRQDCT